MKALPLQTRVAILSAILIGTTLCVIGCGVSLYLYQQALRGLDEQLSRVAERIFVELQSEENAGAPISQRAAELAELLPTGSPTFFLEAARVSDNSIFFRSESLKDRALPLRSGGFSNAQIGEDGVRMATFTRNDVTLRIAADLDPIEALTADLAIAFLSAFTLAFLPVIVGSRWIARTALRPIELIARSAEQVTAQHLDLRVPVPEARDSIRRLALVLNEAFDRLQISFEQAMRFSADASHELKTPLTLLRASIEALLRSPSLAEHDQEVVAGLLEQTKRVTSITSGLLLLARADAGKLVLEERSVDLGEVITACADDAQIVGAARGIKFEITSPPRAKVHGDQTRLMQIVSNLFDNAIKYNHRGGTVRINLEQSGEAWLLRVANTGPGIPSQQRANVFDRFFRVEHFGNVGGHGLGLSLSRELARAHRGDVMLLRSDADWTEFQLLLPIVG